MYVYVYLHAYAAISTDVFFFWLCTFSGIHVQAVQLFPGQLALLRSFLSIRGCAVADPTPVPQGFG